jgi:hypothetical protein
MLSEEKAAPQGAAFSQSKHPYLKRTVSAEKRRDRRATD